VARYVLYARKSSESEDRQVLSIDSQIRELKQYARAQKLDIVEVLAESRSAKAPGRAVFGRLMTMINEGIADAILCWKLDRLARNPVDGGAIIWALDEGKLREIASRERTFTNTGNDKFWMQLEFGMAKKYVDDLSDNVKRGNRAKLEQGWLPGLAPVGYTNDVVKKTIIPDPRRFKLVRKMWDLVLAGRSPIQVLEMANNDWGFRTRRYRRLGGRPLARSTFYKMLSNPFYYGLIVRNGESYQGAHKPMITKDEFERVQELLGRPNRAPTRRHDFAFTGLIQCGECGASITAEETVNQYGRRYYYYHCTKRKTGTSCGQKTIRVEKLEQQILQALGRIQITDDFSNWAISRLRKIHDEETQTRQAVDHSLDKAYRDIQRQIDTLVQMRLRGLLTDEEFIKKKAELTAEALRLEERLRDASSRQKRWLELSEKAIIFAHSAQKAFARGSNSQKRDILVALGSNFVLKDRMLRIYLQKPFRLMEEMAKKSTWLGLVDGFRTFFTEHPTLIQWPSFCNRIISP
jgi:DNA invertase Pin-like site-specific DNA recombinase